MSGVSPFRAIHFEGWGRMAFDILRQCLEGRGKEGTL